LRGLVALAEPALHLLDERLPALPLEGARELPAVVVDERDSVSDDVHDAKPLSVEHAVVDRDGGQAALLPVSRLGLHEDVALRLFGREVTNLELERALEVARVASLDELLEEVLEVLLLRLGLRPPLVAEGALGELVVVEEALEDRGERPVAGLALGLLKELLDGVVVLLNELLGRLGLG